MNKELKGNLILLVTAMAWGLGFAAQKAASLLHPFAYNGIRFVLAGVVLLPMIFVLYRKKEKSSLLPSIKGGICCGLVLCLAANLQQFGIFFETDASKAGFITSLYILFVPLISVFIGKKVPFVAWACVFMGAIGFYFLTMAGKGNGFTLEMGDFYVLICAIVFSVHIIVVDHFSPKCQGLVIASVQFLTAGVIDLILMPIFSNTQPQQVLELWIPIAYGGLISCGIGYTLQVLGQKYANPTTGTMIMSLEAVFSVIFCVLFMGERMTSMEVVGSVIIFSAVMIPQILDWKRSRQNDDNK